MDARLNPYGVLGLQEGDAHVIRNAGGVVTDDEIRSLAISQRLLGTEEIILIHHTDCGMLTFTDDAFKAQVQEETGIKPEWAVEAFPDLDADVRQSIARIKASPFIPRKDSVVASSTRWSRDGCARSSKFAPPLPAARKPRLPDRRSRDRKPATAGFRAAAPPILGRVLQHGLPGQLAHRLHTGAVELHRELPPRLGDRSHLSGWAPPHGRLELGAAEPGVVASEFPEGPVGPADEHGLLLDVIQLVFGLGHVAESSSLGCGVCHPPRRDGDLTIGDSAIVAGQPLGTSTRRAADRRPAAVSVEQPAVLEDTAGKHDVSTPCSQAARVQAVTATPATASWKRVATDPTGTPASMSATIASIVARGSMTRSSPLPSSANGIAGGGRVLTRRLELDRRLTLVVDFGAEAAQGRDCVEEPPHARGRRGGDAGPYEI